MTWWVGISDCAAEEVLVRVSSNGWDAAAAAGYGFATAWVNRSGGAGGSAAVDAAPSTDEI